MRHKGSLLALVAVYVLTASGAAAAPLHWIGTWTAAQQVPEPQNALPQADLADVTLRQIVHVSAGGPVLRVRLANTFGTAPLYVTSVHIARPVPGRRGAIITASDRALNFSRRSDVIIPAGAQYLSDPIAYSLAPLSDLTITMHLKQLPRVQTGHPGSRSTSYVAAGDQVSAPELADAKKIEHWYWLAGVEVAAPADASAVVVLGDSITDGHASTTDGNDRWPDVLARRLALQQRGRVVGVLNQGIGGNHLLTDGLGPNALARFDRDVLAQPGARYVIVLEGVNDLGALARQAQVTPAAHQQRVQAILAAYQQIIARAHARGMQVLGATITPFAGSDYYHPDAGNEADRQAVNRWIRAPGHFDAVIDFDEVLADPAHPQQLRPDYDCGDHLHPSPAGYEAMGRAVALDLFGR